MINNVIRIDTKFIFLIWFFQRRLAVPKLINFIINDSFRVSANGSNDITHLYLTIFLDENRWCTTQDSSLFSFDDITLMQFFSFCTYKKNYLPLFETKKELSKMHWSVLIIYDGSSMRTWKSLHIFLLTFCCYLYNVIQMICQISISYIT